MAAPQYKQAYTHKRFDTNSPYGTKYTTNLRRVRRVKKREKVQSNNSLQIISVIILFVVFALFVSPVYTDNIVRPIILRTEKYPQIKPLLVNWGYVNPKEKGLSEKEILEIIKE